MAKVDTDKFIALLVETYCRRQGIDRKIVQTYIDDVLEQMGFKVENGEIVELKANAHAVFNEMLDRPITDYPLSVRALNCLKSADINTLRELVRLTEMDLLKFRNFGKKSISELSDFIKDHDLTWGMSV
jgi:DNA-directed RNA polymerase subunit alpha